MSMKIVVLMGSPRKNGNTDLLADAFIQGAKEAGNTVSKVLVSNLQVGGCRDCGYCTSHWGECVQRDGMREVYPLLYEADMAVFATPLYFYGFSAQMKAVIDRLYVAVTKPLPITACALLVPFADRETSGIDPIIQTYRTFTSYLKWEDRGIIAVPNMKEKGAIQGHPALDQARELGRSIR